MTIQPKQLQSERSQVYGTLLSTANVAELLSVTTRTVRRWTAAKLIPSPVRVTSRTVRWPAAAFQAFLDGLAGDRPKYRDA